MFSLSRHAEIALLLSSQTVKLMFNTLFVCPFASFGKTESYFTGKHVKGVSLWPDLTHRGVHLPLALK